MYLIDGNNLMSVNLERKGLLNELARFVGEKKVRVSVVFDGAPEPHFPDGASFQGVKIFYSARNSNADERIKHFAENEKNKNALKVVTNDRELANYVRRCAVKVISCEDFRRKMNEISTVEPEKKPLESVKKEDVSAWMRYFGVDEAEDKPQTKKTTVRVNSPIAEKIALESPKLPKKKKVEKEKNPAKISRKMKKKIR